MKRTKLFLIAEKNDLSLDREAVCKLTNSVNAAEKGLSLIEPIKLSELPEEEIDETGLIVFLLRMPLDQTLIDRLEAKLCGENAKGSIAVFIKRTAERPSKEQKGFEQRLNDITRLCSFSYESEESLCFLFALFLSTQIGFKVSCQNGALELNERGLLALNDIDIYKKNKDYSRLLAEIEEAKGRFTTARAACRENESGEAKLSLYSAAKKLRELYEEKGALENAVAYFLSSVARGMADGKLSTRVRAAHRLFCAGELGKATASLNYQEIAGEISAISRNNGEKAKPYVSELIARAELLSARGYTPERNSEIELCLNAAAKAEERFDLPREALYRILKRKLYYNENAEAANTAKKLTEYYEQKENSSRGAIYAEGLLMLALAERGLSHIAECENACRRLIEYITPIYAVNPSELSGYLYQALTLLCEINVERADPQAATELAEILLSLIDKSLENSGETELFAAIAVARALGEAKEYKRALGLLENAEKRIEQLFNGNEILYSTIYIELLVTKGELYLSQFDYSSAYSYFENASECCSIFHRDGNLGKETLYFRLRFGFARAIMGYKLSYTEASREAQLALEEVKRLFEASPTHYGARYLLSGTLCAVAGISDNEGSEAILREALSKTARFLRKEPFDRIAEGFALKTLAELETGREAKRGNKEATASDNFQALKDSLNQDSHYYSEALLTLRFALLESGKERKSVSLMETLIKQYEAAVGKSEETTDDSKFFIAGFYLTIARLYRQTNEIKSAEKTVMSVYETLGLDRQSMAVDTAFKRAVCVRLYEERCALYLLDGDLEAAKHCSDICINAQRQLLDKSAPLTGVAKIARLYLTRAEEIEDTTDEQERFYRLAEAVLINHTEPKGSGRIPQGSLEEEARVLFCETEESFGWFLSRGGRGGEAIEKYKSGLVDAEYLIKRRIYLGYTLAAGLNAALARRYIEDGEYQSAEAALNSALKYQLNPAALGSKNKFTYAADTLRLISELAELKSKLGYVEEAEGLYQKAIAFVAEKESETALYFKEKGLMLISLAEHYARHGDGRREIVTNRKLARAAFVQGLRLAKNRAQREEFRDIIFDLDHPIGE